MITNIGRSTKKSRKEQEISPYVPVNIIYFQKFVEDLLDPQNPNPREMISKYKEFLTHISFGGEEDEVDEEVMDTFFEF